MVASFGHLLMYFRRIKRACLHCYKRDPTPTHWVYISKICRWRYSWTRVSAKIRLIRHDKVLVASLRIFLCVWWHDYADMIITGVIASWSWIFFAKKVKWILRRTWSASASSRPPANTFTRTTSAGASRTLSLLRKKKSSNGSRDSERSARRETWT